MVYRRVWSSLGRLAMRCHQVGADWFLSLCGTIFNSQRSMPAVGFRALRPSLSPPGECVWVKMRNVD